MVTMGPCCKILATPVSWPKAEFSRLVWICLQAYTCPPLPPKAGRGTGSGSWGMSPSTVGLWCKCYWGDLSPTLGRRPEQEKVRSCFGPWVQPWWPDLAFILGFRKAAHHL